MLRAHITDVTVVHGDTVVDSYALSVGLRTVGVAGIKFLINGEPFSLKGFGGYEDVPVIGKGHNDAYLLHDSRATEMDWSEFFHGWLVPAQC
jgi:beta-glucuronidase